MASFVSAQTSASGGSAFVAFTNKQGFSLAVLNNTGTTLEFRRESDTDAVFQLLDGQAWEFPVSANAKEIEVRRADGDTTQVTIYGEVTP